MKRMQFLCNIGVFLLLLTAMTGCGGNSNSTDILRSEEEKLVEHCRQIDTLSIRQVINPDTIKGASQLEKITADSWILIEEQSGLVVSSKNMTKKQYPASLTKMMTCKLIFEKGHPKDTVRITEDVYLVRDGRVQLNDCFLERDLLHEMMLQSDNDAAYALAKRVAGDTLAFCQLMNERAAFLLMDSTHFANPNGMPNDSTYSSAYDLLTLARYCMSDSLFADLVKADTMKIPMTDGRHLKIENTNTMLKKYKGCFGIKTGYTKKAGGCLAVAAQRDGVTLYLVLLKSRSRSSRFEEAEKLLDYGFRVMEAYQEKMSQRSEEK